MKEVSPYAELTRSLLPVLILFLLLMLALMNGLLNFLVSRSIIRPLSPVENGNGANQGRRAGFSY